MAVDKNEEPVIIKFPGTTATPKASEPEKESPKAEGGLYIPGGFVGGIIGILTLGVASLIGLAKVSREMKEPVLPAAQAPDQNNESKLREFHNRNRKEISEERNR